MESPVIKEGGYIFWKMQSEEGGTCGAEALADSYRVCHMSKK